MSCSKCTYLYIIWMDIFVCHVYGNICMDMFVCHVYGYIFMACVWTYYVGMLCVWTYILCICHVLGTRKRVNFETKIKSAK